LERVGAEIANGRDNFDGLTPRQRESLALLAAGLRSYEIGARLGISEATVKSHLQQIYRRLGVTNRVEASTYYLRATSAIADPSRR
jgi:DNA-binding CsgD family transcriptional regulator